MSRGVLIAALILALSLVSLPALAIVQMESSKLNSYVTLEGKAVESSKLNAYVVLQARGPQGIGRAPMTQGMH
jgi:hypothetical protein